MNDEHPAASRDGIRRRTIIIGAAAGLVTAATSAALPAVAAPTYSPIPKLPFEVSRLDTQVTSIGKKKYEAIDVLYQGDRMRLFVPHASPPKTSVGVLWYYHSNGSDYTSLTNVYKWSAMMAVDAGAVCICADYGGSLWTSQPSLTAQQNATRYMGNVWKIAVSFMRANSGGGPLMTYAYGTKMVPAVRGMYMASAAYDMEDLYDRDPVRIPPVYGFNRDLAVATNPARLPQSSWVGTRIRTVVSMSDPLVPPPQHTLALVDKAAPVARETSVEYHDGGHRVPDWTSTDMIATFKRWLAEG
ncbi:hypothetical protein BJ978_000134 [Agromyces terreus]|uniref:Uncharacterized protein n=1 Tax=Agromyces terreus TaxID=424795 RepID=A0A9X2K9P3_9MICO|nr:hypothetical protein [Agromyces terreus]MCP2369458.1 hypothetical protein [Agromyces terreus]